MADKMAIITSYFQGDNYGLLGPQLAATIIEANTSFKCVVLAVGQEDTGEDVKKALQSFFGPDRPVVGFSTLSGRSELFKLAHELRSEGALTILGGPQSDVDFLGEVGKELSPHRFQGYSDNFSLAVHGPGEQAIPIFADLDHPSQDCSGIIFQGKDGIVQNPAKAWNPDYFRHIRWDNLFRVEDGHMAPITIYLAQVIQQVGCPHAARSKQIAIDYPADLGKAGKVEINLKGCSFCDVATDKGYFGALPFDLVMDQIRNLPEVQGFKIPFELINENPLPSLPKLLEEAKKQAIKISLIDLVMRADWFCRHEDKLREALRMAQDMGVGIRIASMGFESFDDSILQNFNKGTTVEENLKAVTIMRDLKRKFPRNWAYSRQDGSVHGFIHPTPWDTEETMMNMEKVFMIYGLRDDVLPDNSVPLIIHHGCPLGEWAREIEQREGLQFSRNGSIIEWWSLQQQ